MQQRQSSGIAKNGKINDHCFTKRFVQTFNCVIDLYVQICDEGCHHFIFEVQAGARKWTMIWALLREAFGPDKVQVTKQNSLFQHKPLQNIIRIKSAYI